MTSKERVRLAMNFQTPDRIPTGEFAIDYEMVSRVVGKPSLYRGRFLEDQALAAGRWEELAEDYVEDYTEVINFFGWDLVVVNLLPSRHGTFLPWIGCPELGENVYTRDRQLYYSRTPQNWMIRFRDDRPVKGRPLPKTEELAAYAAPALPDESCFVQVEEISRRFGQDHHIALRLPVGIDYPMFGANEEEGFENLLLEEELIDLWMLREHRYKKAYLEMMLDRFPEVDSILAGVDYSSNSGPLVSPALFRKWILPGMRELAAETHRRGKKFILHACGNNWLLLDMFVEAGIDVYQSIQMSASMDIGELKRRYGKQLTLWGGAGMEYLISGTPEDCRREMEHSIRAASSGGGFIAGASHSVGVGVKLENYQAMLAAVRQATPCVEAL